MSVKTAQQYPGPLAHQGESHPDSGGLRLWSFLIFSVISVKDMGKSPLTLPPPQQMCHQVLQLFKLSLSLLSISPESALPESLGSLPEHL